jgi:hypothetical protein
VLARLIARWEPYDGLIPAIEAEAAQSGVTSFVTARCDDGTEICLSQHSSGDWDIVVGDYAIEDIYVADEADQAVREFMDLCRQHNRVA